MRLDSGGKLLIGTAADQHGTGHLLQAASASSTGSLSLNRYSANAHPSYIEFFKSRNASVSGQTVVQDGDNLGQITWSGSDGTNRAYAAFIDAEVDGTPGDGDMPGRLTFSTSADGSESPSERLRIDKRGGFTFSNGGLVEKCNVTAGKLSDNTNIDLEDGMVHYFTTQESTTSTPNIRLSSSGTLNGMMTAGDVITVTLITTTNASGYSANVNIDGVGVTEEWVGGSAPSAGGADGLDIYVYTIICTHATNTGNSGFKVIANVTNATN